MAKKFLTSLDLNKNQLLNAVIDSKSSAPSSPVAGQIYYNTSDATLRYYSGGSNTWITLAQGGDVTTAITNAINALDTDDIPEGANNLYFTNQRAIDAVGGSASSTNTPDTVVKRDGSGNFAAGTITVNEINVNDVLLIEDDGGDIVISNTDNGDIDFNADDIRIQAGDDVTISGNDIRIIPTGNVYISPSANYNTDEQVVTRAFLGDLTIDGSPGNTVTDRINTEIDGLDTDAIEEGTTRLYFTDARARTAISSGDDTISYNSSTGEITANTSTMATVSYVDGEITDLTTYVDQEISDSSNTLTSAYQSADNTLSNTLTIAYQAADTALEASLTQDFQDADNTVIETLRGEIAASAQGLDVKESVRLATTENINMTPGFATTVIDGVSLAFPSTTRVLVKNQTDASENGIYEYVYSMAANTWTRTDDALELTPGTFVFVEEGNTHADSGFVISTDGTITVGTTDITWTQFSGAGQIVAGNGITKTGSTLSVDAGDGITVDGSGVSISNTYAGQTSITTVGTIDTGIWQGSTIDLAYGGTGTDLSGETVGNYVVIGASGYLETIGTVAGADVNGDISGNAVNVTGVVAIANGGTGANTVAGARAALEVTTKYAENNTTLNPVSNTITWTVSHNINTTDVTVQMRDLGDGALVEADVVITNANTVTISWYSAATVSADAYRVVVVG